MQTDTSSRDRSLSLLERIENAFEEVIAWCSDHWPVLLTVLVVLLVVGGAGAGYYEWRKGQRAEAFASLAKVERELAATLPVDASGGLGDSTPANPELAIVPKQEAIEAFGELSAAHSGSEVGFIASLRTAELQVELGEMAAAEETLAGLSSARDVPGALAATAHRLRGYALEELGRPEEAAEAYLRAAGIQDYPARADAFWQAGTTFERIGEWARAVEAYDASVSVSPEFGVRNRVGDRLIAVRAKLERGASPEPPASGSETNSASEVPSAEGAADATAAAVDSSSEEEPAAPPAP